MLGLPGPAAGEEPRRCRAAAVLRRPAVRDRCDTGRLPAAPAVLRWIVDRDEPEGGAGDGPRPAPERPRPEGPGHHYGLPALPAQPGVLPTAREPRGRDRIRGAHPVAPPTAGH